MDWFWLYAYPLLVGIVFGYPFYWLARWRKPPDPTWLAAGSGLLVGVPITLLTVLNTWLTS